MPDKTDNATRNQYLSAMGIDVWVSKDDNNIAQAGMNQVNNNQVSIKSISENAVTKNSELTSGDSAIALKVEPEFETETVTINIESLDWPELTKVVNNCQICEQLNSRTNCVFGAGNQTAELFIVGSMPSIGESNIVNAFIGAEGLLLDNMLLALNLTRDKVYTTNLIKCASQSHRQFSNSEMENCISYLERQIALVNPKVMIIFGEQVAQFILKTDKDMATLTTQLHDYLEKDILVAVIEHPEQLLSSAISKKHAWLNLLQIKTMLR